MTTMAHRGKVCHSSLRRRRPGKDCQACSSVNASPPYTRGPCPPFASSTSRSTYVPIIVHDANTKDDDKEEEGKSKPSAKLNFRQSRSFHRCCWQQQWQWQRQMIILLLSSKDLGGRGWSEEKLFHAVNSKQKLTKNSFLVGSFLTC
jgi:hypothetical protein